MLFTPLGFHMRLQTKDCKSHLIDSCDGIGRVYGNSFVFIASFDFKHATIKLCLNDEFDMFLTSFTGLKAHGTRWILKTEEEE